MHGCHAPKLTPSGLSAFPAEILQHRTIRGEAKLLWLWLWEQAGFRPNTLSINPAAVAAALGGSERAARRWVESLEAARLIEIVDRAPGVITLYVQVEQSPVVRPDPQPELFAAEPEPEPAAVSAVAGRIAPAVSVPKPPAVSVPKPPSTPAAVPSPATPEPSLSAQLRAVLDLPAAAAPAAKPAGADIGYLYQDQNLISAQDQTRRARHWERAICEELQDDQVNPSVVAKIAARLADDSLQWEDVRRAILNARKAQAAGKCPRGQYFIGAAKKLFSERGLKWSRKPR